MPSSVAAALAVVALHELLLAAAGWHSLQVPQQTSLLQVPMNF